jgi:hypothetical protein
VSDSGIYANVVVILVAACHEPAGRRRCATGPWTSIGYLHPSEHNRRFGTGAVGFGVELSGLGFGALPDGQMGDDRYYRAAYKRGKETNNERRAHGVPPSQPGSGS